MWNGLYSLSFGKKYRVDVIAADINLKVLKWAEKRITEEGVGDRVTVIEADAHKLPFLADTFDSVIIESLLIFCDQKKVSSEAYRVLKPDGVFGDNEATYLKRPPGHVRASLSGSLGVRPLLEGEWRGVFREAGFVDVSSAVYRSSEREQFLSHLQVDGVRRVLLSYIQSISDPTIRGIFLNKGMLRAMFQYSSYVGYGLYVGRKSLRSY
ncbi:MAG: methyltransferase domain-containing protein [Candidatus Bathyarchaeia archaeon]